MSGFFRLKTETNRCTDGNGGSGKGGKSGKGSAKSHFLQGLERNDPELEFRQQVKDSMPTAAKLRLQPRLIQSEWDAPILHWQNLNATGGVSICPKESLPQVLANVGYTAHPCAVVITQSPEEVRLQAEIDAGRCVLPLLSSDPRPRMKVLRLLLVGSLLSPEANHRHRKLPGAITCGCGGNPTNHHIHGSVHCSKTSETPSASPCSIIQTHRIFFLCVFNTPP